jgi:hypothetical protein
MQENVSEGKDQILFILLFPLDLSSLERYVLNRFLPNFRCKIVILSIIKAMIEELLKVN